VADSEDEDLIFQDSIDHTVIADTIPPKTCELSFEDWKGVGVLRKLFLDLTQDASSFCLGQPFQVTLNGSLIDNVISQVTSSSLSLK